MEIDLIHYTLIDIRLAYVAGFFDGEGCIQAEKPTGVLRISAVNTDHNALIFVQEVLGGSIIKSSARQEQENAKPMYLWRMNGVKASEALEKLLPYLITKKERALLCLELPYDTPRKRREIMEKMVILNKKGAGRRKTYESKGS